MRFLLDTNICIYLARQQPPQVVRRLEALHEGDVAMSVVTYAELLAGIEMRPADRDPNRRALEGLVGRIPAVPLDAEVARHYGVLRAAVPDRRRDAFDRLIAAHARSLDATLVTNNLGDFSVYPGLKLENWAA